jgi:hypothetical protein
MGEKWREQKQSPISWTLFFFTAGKKTDSKIFLDSVFFEPILAHVWDSVFFQTTKNDKFSLPLPDVFQHQGSGNSVRGAQGNLWLLLAQTFELLLRRLYFPCSDLP